MRRLFLSLILVAAFPAIALASETIGFKEMQLPDKEGSRPLHVALWYPTDDQGRQEAVAENPVFIGVDVVKAAQPASGAHPLVVLSHGYGGSWRNLSWLAAALASQGYVVAAPDHPGTTTFDRDPAKAASLWERPRDLSRVIDAVSTDQQIARGRIAAIGHSLGGWTVTELAGGRFEAARVTRDCLTQFGPVTCKLFTELGAGDDANAKLAGDLRDPRVGAAVTLDLGPARG
ncbi:MAG TPA: alpha/beta fold hydrolase, partial [Nordella sp.]|nr:alpha/beta fold hydrolase [Nordella sp.]